MLTSQGFQIQTKGTQQIDTLVPHNVDAEAGLLGALAIDPDRMIEVGYLSKSDFYLTSNGIIYDAMKNLFDKAQTYDLITLTNALEVSGRLEIIGGPGVIADFINFTPTSFNADHYAAIIYKSAVLRRVISEATTTAQAAYAAGDMTAAEVVSAAVLRFSEIDATKNVSGGPEPIENGANKLLDRREQIQANGGKLPGLMTGIKTLDVILDGVEKGCLYLLAGRPGMGKSALFLQMAYNIAKAGNGVLYFSLEMAEEQITARLASIHCRIPYKDILAGRGDDYTIIQAIDFISQLPIIVDTTPGLTVSEIRSRAQKVTISEDMALLGVDHGGLVRPSRPTGNIYADTSQVAAELQFLPKQLGIAVMALLQLKREPTTRNDKHPKLSDLRDTGRWEENADGVLFVHRDQYYNPDTEFPKIGEIIAAKNRAGASDGSATVYVDVATNRFVDLETRNLP